MIQFIKETGGFLKFLFEEMCEQMFMGSDWMRNNDLGVDE